MLTDDQNNSVVNCVKLGQETVFDFHGAPLCDVINEIVEHLETERMEGILFGLPMIEGHSEVAMYDTPEEAQRAFVHHAMHWAFQLGVGAALVAVGQDMAGNK